MFRTTTLARIHGAPRSWLALAAIGAATVTQGLAQARYAPGAYVAPGGQRYEGQILDRDWGTNPTSIRFRPADGAAGRTVGLPELASFRVGDRARYVRAVVPVAPRVRGTADVSREREPDFPTDTVLLRALIEGEAALYELRRGPAYNYYYRVGEGPITRLVHNTYLGPDGRTRVNADYRRQLARDVACGGPTGDLPAYERRGLADYFRAYHACRDVAFEDYDDDGGIGELHLRVRPGVVGSTFVFETASGSEIDFGTAVGWRLGLELEYVLPIRGGQWSLLAEPTYISRGGSQQFGTRTPRVLTFDYRGIDVPLGVRYGLRVGSRARLLTDAGLSVTLNLPTDFALSNLVELEAGRVSSTWFLSVGYEYADRYSISARVQTSRDLLDEFNYRTRYPSASLVVGYRML